MPRRQYIAISDSPMQNNNQTCTQSRPAKWIKGCSLFGAAAGATTVGGAFALPGFLIDKLFCLPSGTGCTETWLLAGMFIGSIGGGATGLSIGLATCGCSYICDCSDNCDSISNAVLDKVYSEFPRETPTPSPQIMS